MEGAVALIGALVVALCLGLLLKRAPRRLARTTPPSTSSALGAADLGDDLGERATLVQFSSAFCQPCRATRRVLADVSASIAGVHHVEIDAESHLELVRRLDIRRTPTVLVLDRAGNVVRRATGQPRPADVIAAVGAAVDAGEPSA